MAPPVLSLALPSKTGRVLSIQSHTVQILSRKTHIDDEIYNQLVQRAREEGYDVSKLHKTPQSDPPPEGEEGLKDTKGI